MSQGNRTHESKGDLEVMAALGATVLVAVNYYSDYDSRLMQLWSCNNTQKSKLKVLYYSKQCDGDYIMLFRTNHFTVLKNNLSRKIHLRYYL